LTRNLYISWGGLYSSGYTPQSAPHNHAFINA